MCNIEIKLKIPIINVRFLSLVFKKLNKNLLKQKHSFKLFKISKCCELIYCDINVFQECFQI